MGRSQGSLTERDPLPARVAPPSPRRRLRRAGATAGLLALPVVWLAVLFLAPVAIVGLYSVGVLEFFPGDGGFTLATWREFFESSIYPSLLWKSVRTALIVGVACVVLAYPIAYTLALLAGKRRYVLLLLIIVPFWTSFLLRVFAWKVILGENGVINSLLFSLGLREDGNPLPQLIYSPTTVILVLVYTWVPFVVLPIFVSLTSLDRRLLEAAADLGASRLESFIQVTLPLSLPGVFAGFAFAFIPTIGEFVTPSLVGGPEGFLYGNAIANLFGPSFDWKTGSVLALVLFASVAALTLLFARFLQLRNVAALEEA